MDLIGMGAEMFSSTKIGATRSFFDNVTSHRSGWIFRARDRLIRRWGNMLRYQLRLSGYLHFKKNPSYVWLHVVTVELGFSHRYDRNASSNIRSHLKELKLAF